MNKLNTRRIDRFIERYRREQQVGYCVAEERLMREFQRRVARRVKPQAPTAPAAPNGQQMASQQPGQLELALQESIV